MSKKTLSILERSLASLLAVVSIYSIAHTEFISSRGKEREGIIEEPSSFYSSTDTLSAPAATPSSNTGLLVMNDVTGDKLEDILISKNGRTFIQKNLGRGRYAEPVDFEEAQRTGYFGPKSDYEHGEMALLTFAGGILLGGVALLIHCIGCRYYHPKNREIPLAQIPLFFRSDMDEYRGE